MSGVWFTSDQHYGHKLVAELRGFASTDEHDDAIDANYRALIRKADAQVWFLGDLSLKGTETALRPIIERIAALPGRKHLIAGNHDPIHPMHRDAHKFADLYRIAFESVSVYARRRIGGRDVMLSHFPYAADRGFEARHPQYRLPDLGMPLIHGHMHVSERRTGPREVHIGLDAWNLRPVNVSEIEPLLDEVA